MFLDCCLRFHAQGERVCPVCRGQLGADRLEMEQARRFRADDPPDSPARLLVEARAFPPEEVGLGANVTRALLRKKPARREVFRLLGIYLPEREARTALKRIHEYKWLESERAGFDVWQVTQPNCPLRAAALHWARRHFKAFLRACPPFSSSSGLFA